MVQSLIDVIEIPHSVTSMQKIIERVKNLYCGFQLTETRCEGNTNTFICSKALSVLGCLVFPQQQDYCEL